MVHDMWQHHLDALLDVQPTLKEALADRGLSETAVFLEAEDGGSGAASGAGQGEGKLEWTGAGSVSCKTTGCLFVPEGRAVYLAVEKITRQFAQGDLVEVDELRAFFPSWFWVFCVVLEETAAPSNGANSPKT